MKVIALDTETTGVTNKDEVIELAILHLPSLEDLKKLSSEGAESCVEVFSKLTSVQRFLPSCDTHPKALEVHGITFKSLLGSPRSKTLIAPEADMYVGHNISFDHRMLKQPQVKLFCTLSLSKSITKHKGVIYENNSLDTLIAFYFPELSESLSPKLHSAKLDTIKTALLSLRLLEEFPGIYSWEEAYEFQQRFICGKPV